jgi:hypothetical protein
MKKAKYKYATRIRESHYLESFAIKNRSRSAIAAASCSPAERQALPLSGSNRMLL